MDEIQKKEINELIAITVKELDESSTFTSRQRTDTPTDAYQVANKKYVDGTVITLTDGATVSLNSETGSYFLLTAGGNRTISVPSFVRPYRKKIIIIHKASGADRTLTLTTGSAGAFRFGSDFTTLSATASGKTDYIGCIYNLTDKRWDVVAVTKGF